VLTSGTKTFRWYCTARKKVFTIGPWALQEQPGHVTLDQAREWLDRLKKAHVAGTIDAVAFELADHLRRREHIADPTPADRKLFGTIMEEFYKDDIERNRKHPEDVRAVMDRDVLPFLKHRPLEDVTTLDVRDVVKRTVARGATTHAGRVLGTLKQFFSWAQANGFTDKNPAAPLKARHLGVAESRRSRWLGAEEIPVFLHALDAAVGSDRPAHQKIRPATSAGMKVLLLTAVRTGELLRARWAHVDVAAKTWTIPVENQKLSRKQETDAKDFIIPLTPTALELLEELKEQADGSPWVMAGKNPKKHADEKIFGHAIRRLVKAKTLVLAGGPFTIHDLRRTARTHLGKLRVPLHIAERCLNHSLGKIVHTYDQFDDLEQRREALERWDAFILGLLNPEAAKVIPLVVEGSR
jgi:integrase